MDQFVFIFSYRIALGLQVECTLISPGNAITFLFISVRALSPTSVNRRSKLGRKVNTWHLGANILKCAPPSNFLNIGLI